MFFEYFVKMRSFQNDHEKITVTYNLDEVKVDMCNEKNFEHYFEKFELLKLVWKVTNQWDYITISKETDFEDNFEFIIDRQTCPKCWCIL